MCLPVVASSCVCVCVSDSETRRYGGSLLFLCCVVCEERMKVEGVIPKSEREKAREYLCRGGEERGKGRVRSILR